LGHASASSLHSIANKISCNLNKIELCNACCLAKSHILPFQSSSTVVQKPLECVHCDVGGASPITAHNGARYYVLFTDQYSKYNWIYFCGQKSEVAAVFAQFKVLVENILSCTIKTMQVDGNSFHFCDHIQQFSFMFLAHIPLSKMN
jgi:hypothetical protein